MTEPVRFYFDPRCPWCYQTSRWARRLAELGEIRLDWGVFSLALINAGDEDVDGEAPAQAGIRTVIRARQAAGADGVNHFYAALGRRIHELAEPADDPATVIDALRDADLATDLLREATTDPSTWTTVKEEHTALVERTRSFGVPTIVLDGGEGPAIFGPVISNVPSDDDGVELFRHVAWLARYENFSELKRNRTTDPDLETFRRRRAQGR